MGAKEKVKEMMAVVNIEPVYFLYFLSIGLLSMPVQQLYLEKACKVNLGLNDTVCQDISAHMEVQVEAQGLVAEIQVGYKL